MGLQQINVVGLYRVLQVIAVDFVLGVWSKIRACSGEWHPDDAATHPPSKKIDVVTIAPNGVVDGAR